MRNLEDIETRFKEKTGIKCDLTKFPLNENDEHTRVKTDKDKCKEYGEVFTPLWLVDKMILKAPDSLINAKSTLDLCAGHGQFTIRMMRFLANNSLNFNPEEWLKHVHSLSELQFESAYKLLYIFGPNINLFIGDSQYLDSLKAGDLGILIYIERKNEWLNVTKELKGISSESEFLEKLIAIKKIKEDSIPQISSFGGLFQAPEILM